MYGCERGTIKKAEHQRIDAFELWCWRRLLRILWTARRSNQSILKEMSPGCSLEGLMLKLKIQRLIGPPDAKSWVIWKRSWCWERLRAGEGDNRGWDGWMASLNRWTWVWVDSGSWWWTEAWCAAIHGVAKSRTRLSNWTKLNWWPLPLFFAYHKLKCFFKKLFLGAWDKLGW